MRNILTLLFFSVIGSASACVCFDIDSVFAKKLTDEVEFVIIGRAVRNVGYLEEINSKWDQQGQGSDVLLEVDSVLKGDVQAKAFYIKQFGGNCDRVFEFGKQYLIFGNDVEKFILGSQKQKRTNRRRLPKTHGLPPPPPELSSGVLTFQNSDKNEVDFWNKLSREVKVLNTSKCTSFFLNSEVDRSLLGN